ncbi:MAG: preprotein translocase subunit SecE [Candidatus Cloacimonadota bacterium]|nr:MAG: preprotein translocase subunit SecE [Candidatus Cloacimonadota bacterium]
MNKISDFFKEVKKELKLVSWPTKDDLKEGTAVVITMSIIVGTFLFLIDGIFGYLVNFTL